MRSMVHRKLSEAQALVREHSEKSAKMVTISPRKTAKPESNIGLT